MRDKESIKGYLFDYGGTLDTGGCHWGRMLWYAYQRAAVPVTEQQFREAYVEVERYLGRTPVIQKDYTFRRTLSEKIALQLERLGLLGSSPSLRTFHAAILDDLYAQVVRHTWHSREVLARLGEHSRLALVSNFYGNLVTVLQEFGLSGFFCAVIESAVVGVRKPDPQIFRLGVEALGMSASDVVVVGDSLEKDIVPARAVGCQTVWLKGQGWAESAPAEPVAGRVIVKLEELLA